MIPRAYKNAKRNSLYPFIDTVPFGLGLIKDIKIGFKKVFTEVYVTSISIGDSSFSLNISSGSTLLGTFSYLNNLWITLDNDNLFGFVLLGDKPNDNKTYTGKWQLDKKCYTNPVNIGGITKITVNNTLYTNKDTIAFRFLGNIQQLLNWLSNSNIIIARSTDLLTSYTLTNINTDNSTYITLINSVNCVALDIHSSDSNINIDTSKLTDNCYVILVSSKNNFPTCSKQTENVNDNL